MLAFRIILLTLFYLFATSVLAETPAKSAPLKPVTLQLMWKHQFEFAGFYAAIHKGFYKEVGLEVNLKEFEYNSNITQTVLSGKADYGINDSSLIIDRDLGSPVVLLKNIFQHSPIVLITKNSSNITSPSELIGKKVMLAGHELKNAAIIAMLAKESVSIDQLNIVEHSFNIDDLINGKVDAMSAFVTNEPIMFKSKGVDINIINPLNYGIDFYGNNIFTSEKQLQQHPIITRNFIRASLKGWDYALKHSDEIIEIILKHYNTQSKSKAQLQYEARSIKQMILPNFIPLGSIDTHRLERIVQTYNELGLLKHPFDSDSFIYRPSKKQTRLELTSEEKQWLNQHPMLRLGVDPNRAPFEFINDKGVYSGMGADLIKKISSIVGFTYKVKHHDDWSQVINSAKNRTIDIIPAIAESEQRDEFLEFTKPHISYPMVIVSNKDAPFISQLSELKHQKVAVVKGYITEELLRQNHPELDIVTTPNIEEGLKLITNNDVSAFVDNLATTTQAISREGYSNLRISGTTPYGFDLAIATPKGNEILIGILQKALKSLGKEQIEAIKRKWISVDYTQKVDYTFVYQILVLFFIIVLVILYWNRKLSAEVHIRKQAESAAKQSEKKFLTLFEDNKIVQLIINPDEGHIIKANQAASRFYGYPISQLINMPLSNINTLDEDEIAYEMLLARQQKRAYFNFKHRLASGEIRDVEVYSSPVQWGTMTALYSIIHDVTNEEILKKEISKQTQILKHQASHDALTGLLNRREFETRLAQCVKNCNNFSSNCNYIIFAMDLDNFKVVNDTAGHAAGDNALKSISHLISEKVRERDTLARIGGDEYAMILENCSIEDATNIATSIIHSIKSFNFSWEEQVFRIGISIGITSIYRGLEDTVDDIYNRADAACYQVKKQGRNNYKIYDQQSQDIHKQKGERWWTNEIINAIEDNRFCLYHQKIEALQTPIQGYHYEILLRLKSMDGELIFPDSFIPAAEQYNLMPLVDEWVINNVFNFLENNPEHLTNLHKCSINLSGQSIGADSIFNTVNKRFKKQLVSPEKISWEITETTAITDPAKANEFIGLMRNMGCSFSLDDFGSGLSSYHYLKKLEADFIKIDGAFVTEVVNNPKDQLIVQSIQSVSQGLNMKTIAEFVETEAIKNKLKTLKVDYAQGYFIHKPEPLIG